MNREDLLNNKGYWIAKIQIDLFNQLSEYMEKNDLNRSQFAKKLGVSKGYISQILNGDFNHRISKLVELALAMGKVPELKYVDLSELINEKTTFKLHESKNIIDLPINQTNTFGGVIDFEEVMTIDAFPNAS